jgi:hypothetical protein
MHIFSFQNKWIILCSQEGLQNSYPAQFRILFGQQHFIQNIKSTKQAEGITSRGEHGILESCRIRQNLTESNGIQ